MLASAQIRPWLIGLGVVVVATVAGLAWYLGGSEPAAVDLRSLADEDDHLGDGDSDEDGGIGQDDDGGDDGGDAAVDDPAGSASDMDEPPSNDDLARDGTWVVDTEAVAFDGETGDGSFAGYRVDEELSGIGATTAVGRTPVVDGSITVEAGEVTSAEVVADLTALTSDDGRRDSRVRSIWSADGTATFVLAGGIPAEIDPNGDVTEVTATGDLTIENVTNPVEVTLQVVSMDGRVVVAGSTTIGLADFDVEAPSAPIVLSVADEAVIEWQLHLAPSEGS